MHFFRSNQITNAFIDTKQTRVVKKTIPTPSFFDFFNPATPPSDDDEEIDEDIEQKLELDYQLGEDIKEKLIPRAIDWFTGEALQFEHGMDDFDEDDFEDEDDLDDDEDRDDDDEEEEDDDEVRKARVLLEISQLANESLQEDGSRPKQEAAECKQS
jgi:nucleosome assembly protein 1-like 1